jgi:hypothetical protein
VAEAAGGDPVGPQRSLACPQVWGAYLMGLPRISAMMALSPPRYWKQRLRKL